MLEISRRWFLVIRASILFLLFFPFLARPFCESYEGVKDRHALSDQRDQGDSRQDQENFSNRDRHMSFPPIGLPLQSHWRFFSDSMLPYRLFSVRDHARVSYAVEGVLAILRTAEFRDATLTHGLRAT